MTVSADVSKPTQTQRQTVIDLSAGHRLVLERHRDEDEIQIMAADGHMSLSIRVTPQGPVLRFDGPGLKIETAGELSVEAQRLNLHGRSGVSVTSAGDVHIQTPGDLHSHARIQNITADLGNVNIKANDDVKLNGERVRANC